MDSNPTIPDSVIALGHDAILRYICHGTDMGLFLRQPVMLSVLAEDEVLAEARDALDLPHFLAGETRFVRDWIETRGQSAEALVIRAEAELAEYAPFQSPADARRRLLRLAAYRRLDVLRQGSQIASPSPEFAGEPYFMLPLEGNIDPIPIGRVSSVMWCPDPKLDSESLEFCLKPGAVEMVERALEPLLNHEAGRAGWERVAETRALLEEVAIWDRENALPILLQGVILNSKTPPKGISLRPQVAALIESQGNDSILSILMWMGISPFILDSLLPFLASRGQAIEDAMHDDDLILRFVQGCPAARKIAVGLQEQAKLAVAV